MHDLSSTAVAFVEMAHRIVWCVVATTDPSGRPATRVLHPIWEWDGESLTGWIATSPLSPKAAHLAGQPSVSLTYWHPSQDTCTADCQVRWDDSPELRRAGWERFADGPDPVGYDPSIVPGWDAPESPGFGVLRLEPVRLRVMPGSVLLQGQGEVLTWRST
jgi:hypothetical protein